jgi:hypothetical protein
MNARNILIGLVLLGVLLIGIAKFGSFLSDPFNMKERELDAAKIEEALAKGDAAAQRAQGGVYKDASAIVNIARAREEIVRSINEENSRKLQGMDTPLPTEFVDTINTGLCNYKSTPGCPSS